MDEARIQARKDVLRGSVRMYHHMLQGNRSMGYDSLLEFLGKDADVLSSSLDVLMAIGLLEREVGRVGKYMYKALEGGR